MQELPSKPTLRIKAALDELLQRNERTRGKETGEMYLGEDIFVVRLRQTRVVEGECEPLDRTVDLFDLMEQRAVESDE
jgi:hypothetical protein